MRFLISISFLASQSFMAVAAEKLPPLTESKPIFPANGTVQRCNTRIIKGKTVTQITGPVIKLICYSRGTPQLESVRTGKRIGGFSILANGKPQKGTRSEIKNIIRYEFPDKGEMTMQLTGDGGVAVKTSFPKAAKIQFHIPLKGDFIGGSAMKIDDKKIMVPAFTGKIKHSYARLFNGPVANISLLANSTTGGFSIKTISKTTTKIGCFFKAKSIDLCLQPEQTGNSLEFIIYPGPVNSGSDSAPKDRVTKGGPVDFWGYDRYCLPDSRGKNLLQNSSFEQGMRYLTFRPFQRGRLTPEIWRSKPITISSKEAKFGQKSLSISSDSPEHNLKQVITTHSVILTPGSYTLSLYAKTNQPGRQKLQVAFLDPCNAYNRLKWTSMTCDLTGEWKRYSLSKTIKSSNATAIVFSAESNCKALCYIDGMQLEKSASATEYKPPVIEGVLRTSASDNLVEYGKKPNAELDIITSPGLTGKMKVNVRDFFDALKLSRTFTFKADSTGQARIKLPLNDLPRGIFIVETDYELPNKVKRYEIQRFAIMSFLGNTHKHKNLFVDTYVDPLGTQQIYPEVLKRYKKIGIGARSGFVNRAPLLSKEAARYGVRSSICRIGNPYGRKNVPGRKIHYLDNVEWYLIPGMTSKGALLVDDWRLKTPHVTTEYLKKVEDAAAHIAATSPEIKVWTNLVEPEGIMPDLAHPAYAKAENFMDFVKLECAVGRGVKKGNPKAMLANSIPANISRNDRMMYLDSLLKETSKRGLRYDCIAAHIYRPAPEYPGDNGLEGDFSRVFKIMAKYGYDKTPVLCPEGMHWLPVRCYSSPFVQDYALQAKLPGLLPYTYDLSYGEKLGSALRARTWLVGLKLQDRVKELSAGNYGLFAMDAMLTPYAFQKIPNTLGHLLGNAVFKADLRLFPDTRCFIFEDEKKRPVAALWACAEDFDRGKFKAPEFYFKPVGKLQLFDLMEAEHSIDPGKNGLFRLPLSPFPVFLRGEPGTINQFKAMLTAGRFKSLIPIRPALRIRLIDSTSLKAALNNPFPSVLKGKLSCRANQKTCALPPGSTTDFKFNLPVRLSASALQLLNMDFILKIQSPEQKTFTYPRIFSAMSAKKAPGNITVDGKLDDWRGIPAIPVSRRIRGKKMIMTGKFPDNNDFSAGYRVCWTRNKLYIAVEVKDNKLGYQKRMLRQGWKNDSLQLFFDPFADGHDAEENSCGPDDWEYGIFIKDKSPQLDVYRYRTPDVQLTRGTLGAKPGTVADDVQGVFRKTGDGYVYELAFSADSLMPFQLRAGNTIGLGLLLNDSDDPAEQEPASRLTNTSRKGMPNNRPDLWPLVLLIDK